jgi:predicted RNA-binding protein with PIN domain
MATPRHIVIDAMNVIGSRPTGWWRDRDGAVRGLLERVQRLAVASSCEVTVVIDGRPLRDRPEGRYDAVNVLYASRSGPNAADDRIIEMLREYSDASTIEVVTSDRNLAERARGLGARVRGASSLLDQLDEIEH